jgi:hypothetical protein
MNITKKKAILLAAVMLVLVPTAVTVFAQPSGIVKEKGVVRPLLMGQGFALNGTDYHVLDVSAMITNRNNSQMATRTMAHLRFAGQAYTLNITSYDNQSLTGDVMTLPPRGTNKTDFNPAKVGHITLSMSQKEGVLFSTGTLTMNGTNYNALLTSPIMASGPHKSNGMFGKRSFIGTFRHSNSKR